MSPIAVYIKDELNEISSPEIQELVSYRPHFIVRNGNIIFSLIIFALLAIAWFVKYPDTSQGSMKLVSMNESRLLVSMTDGKLQKLLVSNEQRVKKGELLAFLQSTATHEEVLSLQAWIREVEPLVIKDNLNILVADPAPQYSELGELQSSYEEFRNALKETIEGLPNGYYQQKRRALQIDISYLSALKTSTRRQQVLIKQDYDLQAMEYQANELLAKDKVIAPLELNQNKSKVLNKGQILEQISAQLVNNDISTHDKEKEILDLQRNVSDQHEKFRSALFNLKSKVQEWIRQYIITATGDGELLFASFLQENEQLVHGQELFYIQPPKSRYYGQLMVPQNGLGKIRVGQKVIIRVESYPSNEFGYLMGIVNYIPVIPVNKDSFLIKVDLPAGLKTSYNRTLFFRDNLQAHAEVITDDRRLLNRFLGTLNEAFH